jgi:hypothetical protein
MMDATAGSRLATLPGDIAQAFRLLRGLRPFLRRRVSPEQARTILDARLRNREANFLRLMGCTVYTAADSPYRALLREARCELADLERLVWRDGIERTLEAPHQHVPVVVDGNDHRHERVIRGGLRGRPGTARSPQQCHDARQLAEAS